MEKLKFIAFDADDTLWINEPYYRETEKAFCEMLEDYMPYDEAAKELLNTEVGNIPLYGYGGKSFILSKIETIIKITNGKASMDFIQRAIDLGKELLSKPVIVLDGVENVLKELSQKYKLILATKGDLLDQQRKLTESGLEKYFFHVEIMSDKKVADYSKILDKLDCKAEEFLMIGNSLKSDILPLLEIGVKAVHIPFHTTWAHEHIDTIIDNEDFTELKNISYLLDIIP